MKNTTRFLAVIPLLVLAACSTSAAGDAEPTPLPVASAAPTTATTGDATIGSEGTPDASASATGIPTAPTGDVDATIGQQVGLVDSEGASQFGLTLTGITFPTTCASRLADGTTHTSENGHFLVADIDATMATTYTHHTTGEDQPFLTLDTDAWYIADTNGVLQDNVNTVSAYGCYPTGQRITPFINPGEHVTGKVVLDTNLTHGYLIYNPWGVTGSGWRWAF